MIAIAGFLALLVLIFIFEPIIEGVKYVMTKDTKYLEKLKELLDDF